MKKFFEKHDLFKLLGIMMVITALLTWVIRYSVFQNGELMTFEETVKGLPAIMDQSTIGIFDFNTYALLVLYYFTNIFAFVFVIFSFYKVLGKSRIYDAIITKIADLFKGKDLIFAGISMVFYAAFVSITAEPIVALVFIPFTLSVFAKLKTDKISAFASSFGGMLIGVLGATYSTKIVGSLINYGSIQIKYGNEIWGVIILAVIALIALLGLVSMRLKSKEKLEVIEEKFITVEPVKGKKKRLNNVSLVFTIISLAVVAIVITLAFVPWTTFNVDTFTKFHTQLTEATLFDAGYPLVFLGSQTLTAFGEWDLFTASSFLILMTIIVKFVAGIKFDEAIDGVSEGLKDSIKPAGLLLMIYAVLVFAVSYPTIPYIISKLNGFISADILRPINWVINGMISSLFTVDMQYNASILGGLFSTFDKQNVVAVAMQASYGLAGFIAPTSAFLILGLSMLDIKFKDYLKFIWKFLAAIFVVVLIVLYILLYI